MPSILYDDSFLFHRGTDVAVRISLLCRRATLLSMSWLSRQSRFHSLSEQEYEI